MKLFTFSAALSLLGLCLFACHVPTAKKQKQPVTSVTDSSTVKYELLTDAIQSPVQLLAPPDHTERLFVCDLSGKIFILKDGHCLQFPFIDVGSKLEQKDTTPDVRAVYSLAFHPDFANNKKFYLCYNAPANNTSDKCTLRISEFQVRADNPDAADPGSERTIMEIVGSHVADDDCEMAFGPDGYLYIATGAHSTPEESQQAQDLHSLLGKLLRIDVNKTPYAVPADNPFVNDNRMRPEIWAYGLRRVWRFSFDSQTHQLFGGDVGDKKQEEIDVLQKGGNYGWPVMEGDSLLVNNAAVNTSTFVAPVNTYTHKDGICVIGGSVYHGMELSFLNDKYVFADLNGNLFALAKNATGKWLRQPLKLLNPPADPLLIYSLDQDSMGNLYVSGVRNTHAGFKGVIYKLVHS